jgi:hypothetical protein
MRKSQKTSLVLFVSLFLILIGGSLYLYVNRTLEGDTVKIQKEDVFNAYKNEEYGFEFQYPKNMEFTSSGYKPEWSLFRLELSNIEPSMFAGDKTGGEEIQIDVIKSGVSFTYSKGEYAIYDNNTNTLKLFDVDTQKVVKVFTPILQKSNWLGFTEDESSRLHPGYVYIPSKNKEFIFSVYVGDRNNLENTDLVNDFLTNFSLR